jgi:hypothetical protein
MCKSCLCHPLNIGIIKMCNLLRQRGNYMHNIKKAAFCSHSIYIYIYIYIYICVCVCVWGIQFSVNKQKLHPWTSMNWSVFKFQGLMMVYGKLWIKFWTIQAMRQAHQNRLPSLPSQPEDKDTSSLWNGVGFFNLKQCAMSNISVTAITDPWKGDTVSSVRQELNFCKHYLQELQA